MNNKNDSGSTLQQAVSFLKKKKIECFTLMDVLVVPVSSFDELEKTVSQLAKLLHECDYRGPWRVDPYFYEKHKNY